MDDVFSSGNDFQIIKMVILRISIFVIYLLLWRYLTNEVRHHQSVDR